MRLREIVVVLGAFTFAWAQIESPNSFVGLSVGASAPAGNTASRSLTYPSHGYMRAGGALGLHLNAFIAPYVGLSLRFSQSFLSLDAKALEKRGALFPEPVSISKNPTISHTLVGVGASTGFRWEWISLYAVSYTHL
ncbi:MAG: hypothetical protein N2170_05365, partial [Bacteroidia bacterium]|nr:hypothetical protein [Bacteroidia bacterium]